MAETTSDSKIQSTIIITASTPPGSPRERLDSSSHSSLSPHRRLSDPWNISLNQVDELPIFSIRSVAPSSRSPSPIENISITSIPEVDETNANDDEDVGRNNNGEREQRLHGHGNDLVSLDEINAQISSPANHRPKRAMSLDTIFEGVFLETPPRKMDCNVTSRRQFPSPPRRRMRRSLCCLVLEEEHVQAV